MVYKGLCAFVAKVEEHLGIDEGLDQFEFVCYCLGTTMTSVTVDKFVSYRDHCQLFMFLDAFISDIYLKKVQLQVKEKVDSVVKGNDIVIDACQTVIINFKIFSLFQVLMH